MQKQFRLRATADFTRLRQHGQTRRHPFWIISFIENDCDHNRYGVITSKRLGNAVVRNRVRRHLREALRALHPQIRSSYDIVVIARADVVGKAYQTVFDALSDTLYRCQVLSDSTNH